MCKLAPQLNPIQVRRLGPHCMPKRVSPGRSRACVGSGLLALAPPRTASAVTRYAHRQSSDQQWADVSKALVGHGLDYVFGLNSNILPLVRSGASYSHWVLFSLSSSFICKYFSHRYDNYSLWVRHIACLSFDHWGTWQAINSKLDTGGVRTKT